MKNQLNQYAELAHNILNSNSRFVANRKIIERIFQFEQENTFQIRLTVIDSYYSTQMNKRLFGLEAIVNELETYTDDDLKIHINKFLNEPTKGVIFDLFQKKFGINKHGKSQKKAISLLSKYFYFLVNGEFPIYDELGKVSYKLLCENGYLESSSINEINYFTKIISLKYSSNIHSFEKLDNLLWLIGKISKGSFSILMNKEKYQSITKRVNFTGKESSKDVDLKIREFIKNSYQSLEIFTADEKHFLEFVFSLNN
ncbi:hypothetical protein OO009_03070 [Flavobacteriaceae bacterium KMM 6897]|nr:hypothetical protein [Flavobacteriaceae bacterium KMM 6897]